MLSIHIVHTFGSKVFLLGPRPITVMAFAVCVCFLPLRAAGVSDAPAEGGPFTLSCSATIHSRTLDDFRYGFDASIFLADKRLFFWQGRDGQTQKWIPLYADDQSLWFNPGGIVLQINRISGQLFVMFDEDTKGFGNCSRIQYMPPPERTF